MTRKRSPQSFSTRHPAVVAVHSKANRVLQNAREEQQDGQRGKKGGCSSLGWEGSKGVSGSWETGKGSSQADEVSRLCDDLPKIVDGWNTK
jgi:hypothetical protein